MHCYDRIVEHLQNRQDVDPRSQFPSAKSNNFEYIFLDADKEAKNKAENETAQPEPAVAGGISIESQGNINFPDDAAEFAS